MNTKLIVNAIDVEIKKLIAERYEGLKKDFLERLERDKAIDLAGISVWIMKQIDIQTLSDKTIITLRTENNPKN